MPQDRRLYVGKISRDPPRHIARWRDHTLGAAQQSPERAAPRADVQPPLARAASQACGAARSVRLTAIAAVLGDKMVLGADRVVIVQRAIVRHSNCTRQIEHRSWKPVD